MTGYKPLPAKHDPPPWLLVEPHAAAVIAGGARTRRARGVEVGEAGGQSGGQATRHGSVGDGNRTPVGG